MEYEKGKDFLEDRMGFPLRTSAFFCCEIQILFTAFLAENRRIGTPLHACQLVAELTVCLVC